MDDAFTVNIITKILAIYECYYNEYKTIFISSSSLV